MINEEICKVAIVGAGYITREHNVGSKMVRRSDCGYTKPEFQAQVYFGEFQVENANATIRKLYLFSIILGYSRKPYGGLIERCDPPTFLDCHIHAFEYFGGMPDEILYDRIKTVFIGKIAGKNKFNDTHMGFALHSGFKPEVDPPYAAWLKGKVDYRFLIIS